jgi:hypothetical protein
MVNFKSEGTLNTPAISLNAESQVLTFSGRSLPENAPQFYSPVFDWCNSFLVGCNKNLPTIFEFKLEYFNTSSSKLIYELLKLLSQLPNLEVHWYYEPDDEDLIEAGEEFSELISAKFKFIEIN